MRKDTMEYTKALHKLIANDDALNYIIKAIDDYNLHNMQLRIILKTTGEIISEVDETHNIIIKSLYNLSQYRINQLTQYLDNNCIT